MLKRRKHNTILVGGDFHVPYHDPAAVNVFLQAVEQFRPSAVHILGDLIDFYPLSSHQRNPKLRCSLSEELTRSREILELLRDVAPKALIVYHEGNHENRLPRYLGRGAPELDELELPWINQAVPHLSIPGMLGLADLDIRYRKECQPYTLARGRFVVTHGTLVRTHSAYTARAMLERFGCSVMHGHTHRMGAHYRSVWGRTVGAWENGCLCNLNATPSNAYTKGMPNWQQGFSIIHVINGTQPKLIDVEQVRIHKGGMTRPLRS
jgi:predicted phosphodiesterase